jgi:hypothetical protein
MNLKDFKAGVEIISKYYDDADGYHIGAEHDVFYMYQTDNPITKEDLDALIAHGWFQEEVELGDDDEYKATDYDQEEGWACYT